MLPVVKRRHRNGDFFESARMHKLVSTFFIHAATPRARPYRPGGVFRQSPHELIRQAFTFAEVFPLIVRPMIPPGPFGANPHAPIASRCYRQNGPALPSLERIDCG